MLKIIVAVNKSQVHAKVQKERHAKAAENTDGRLRYCRLMVHGLLLCVVLLSGVYGPVWSQSVSDDKRDTPLYLDLNNSDKSVVYDIHSEVLSLQYNDIYGRAKEIPLRVYNWKRELVFTFGLAKTYGLNYYNISMDEVQGKLEKDVVYMCEVRDEMDRKHVLAVRLVDAPKKEITAGIFVNPKFLKCEEASGNLVEFYGNIKGGKTPYTVSWYVLNDHRTTFLYQPKEQQIERAGSTAAISVDKNPDYYVIMHVKDACGNEQHQVVHLVCDRGRKKVNTVFFESVSELMKPKKIQ